MLPEPNQTSRQTLRIQEIPRRKEKVTVQINTGGQPPFGGEPLTKILLAQNNISNHNGAQ